MRTDGRRAALTLMLMLAAGCSGEPGGPAAQWTVLYSISVVSGTCVVVDSVKYDDGSGTIVKVTAPPNTWGHGFARPTGSLSVQAWAGTCGPANVKLMATWTLPGVAFNADSSVAAPAAGGKFSMTVLNHNF